MGHASRRAFVLLLAVAGVSNAQTCYYPNGTAAEGNYPCVTDAEHSACCGRNDECLTNGLCRPLGADPTSNEFWRDSCTDRTWLSDACPKYCYNSTTNPLAANVNFFAPGCSVDTYCCGDPKPWSEESNYYCCSDENLVFTAGQPEWLSGPSLVIEAFAYSTAVSTTSSTPSVTASQTTSAASIASATGESTTTAQSSGGDNSTTIGVGVGVGVGGALLIIAGVGFFVWRRKQKRGHRGSEVVESSTQAGASGRAKEQAYESPRSPPYPAREVAKPHQARDWGELNGEGSSRLEMAGMGQDRDAAELSADGSNLR